MALSISVLALSFISLWVSFLLCPELKIKGKKIPTYFIVPFLCAVLLLLTKNVSFSLFFNCLTSSDAINPLKILVLFISLSFISIFLDVSGFFARISYLVIKRFSINQYALFFTLYLLTSVLTIFTSNDIVILTLVPFICYFAKHAKINPLPYLVATFAGANTWSMLFLIGNPTNIYLSTSAGITFSSYLKVMYLPTLGAGIVEILLLFLLFNKSLSEKPGLADLEEPTFKFVDCVIGLVVLATVLIFFILSSYIECLDMWLISLFGALVLVVYLVIKTIINIKEYAEVNKKVAGKLPYFIVPFILSMFVIVLSLNENGVSEKLVSLFNKGDYVIFSYGLSSSLFANIMNNIPMSMLYSYLAPVGDSYLATIYASIIGSNLGAFITPVGALAGIMFLNIVSSSGIKYSFKDFVKYGLILFVPTILISLSLLLITI